MGRATLALDKIPKKSSNVTSIFQNSRGGTKMKGIFSAIVLLIGTLALLTFFGGIETCNLANYSFNELFLPARVRIVTRTPAEIKTNNNWTFEKADGQCRVVGIGNNGTTWTADFIDGSWLV
ncbi:MAG TPA: hypothetical protein DEB13_00755, partial [Candidatus Yanofskybacteria bacterium]|nr:hypothetical protein [Candidatus Yanofskybacteria bacterium]